MSKTLTADRMGKLLRGAVPDTDEERAFVAEAEAEFKAAKSENPHAIKWVPSDLPE
jgi:hypothetical protein